MPPHDHQYLKAAMYKHFQVGNLDDMLPHLYKNFEKDFFAQFAVEVVTGAERGDKLSQHVLNGVAQRIGAARRRGRHVPPEIVQPRALPRPSLHPQRIT
jgi:N-acetylglucosamine kinase-like BadF-type ATPase